MQNPLPLIIVAMTILGLLLLQRQLNKLKQQAQIKASTPPPRGKPVVNGLHVLGLDERGISSLLALMKNADEKVLATFLAFNRPAFPELDQYLDYLHDYFKNQTDAVPIESFPQPPAGIQLETLSPSERELIVHFEQRKPRRIDRELMAQFGGHDFLSHFQLYCSREVGQTLHIPPFDADRQQFETLVTTGVAIRGRQIPLQQRLGVMKMPQLRQMAEDLKISKKFTRKLEAIEELSQTPGAAVLLSMQYVIDDLFLLKPLSVDPNAIEQEWDFLIAYAKLLTSVASKHVPI